MITLTQLSCYSPAFPGDEWKILSENVTDSCYVASALPRGPSYVFRVACITRTGTGPFSDPSPSAFMAMPHEGEEISNFCLSSSDSFCCRFHDTAVSFITPGFFSPEDSHVPLILTESTGSKVTVPGGLGSERTYSFLSEINRFFRHTRLLKIEYKKPDLLEQQRRGSTYIVY